MTLNNTSICECRINGRILDPQSYMKVISHDMRKKILHKLHVLSLDEPVSKHQLAEAVGASYEKVHYQLNEHLREFWKIKHREKVRGTYREYIAPEASNTIYLNIGPEKTLYIIDPLANIIGRIKDVGTRCDRCSIEARKECLDAVQTQMCFQIDAEERVKRENVLEDNNRKKPFTPVDYMLVCAVAIYLDQEQCEIKLTNCSCPFLEEIRIKEVKASKK